MTEAGKAVVSMVAGAAAVYGVVEATGMTAVGVIGSGAGFGAAAGPVGLAVGALAGLSVYAVYRVVNG